jgi:hypothetical protein
MDRSLFTFLTGTGEVEEQSFFLFKALDDFLESDLEKSAFLAIFTE